MNRGFILDMYVIYLEEGRDRNKNSVIFLQLFLPHTTFLERVFSY